MGDVTELYGDEIVKAKRELPDEKRCTRIKRNGERCKQARAHGKAMCVTHNGSRVKRNRAGFVRNVAKAKAIAYAAQIVDSEGLEHTPEEHLVDTLMRTDALVRFWGAHLTVMSMIGQEQASKDPGAFRGQLKYSLPTDELDALAVSSDEPLLGFNRHGEAASHPWVLEYMAAIKLKAYVSKLCLDAGIAERRTKIAEEQGQILAAAITGLVAALEVLFGHEIRSHPEYPAIVRRQLVLAAG